MWEKEQKSNTRGVTYKEKQRTMSGLLEFQSRDCAEWKGSFFMEFSRCPVLGFYSGAPLGFGHLRNSNGSTPRHFKQLGAANSTVLNRQKKRNHLWAQVFKAVPQLVKSDLGFFLLWTAPTPPPPQKKRKKFYVIKQASLVYYLPH